MASHSATSPLFKHRQISIERPKLSIAAAVSRAFWSLPVLALPASVFSGQLGILPLSQPSVAHLPPPAAPLAATLPPHPASGSRNTCQGRGHVAAPGDQLPNTPPGKKVELHRPDRRQRSGSSMTASSERRRRGQTQAMMLELSCNLPVIGVCREENPYLATCTGICSSRLL